MALGPAGKTLTALPQSTMAYFMRLSNLNVSLQSAVSVSDPTGMKVRAICNQCHEKYNLNELEISNLLLSLDGYPGLLEFCKAHRHDGVDSETGVQSAASLSNPANQIRVNEPGRRVFKK